jgi:hypothetical protein
MMRVPIILHSRAAVHVGTLAPVRRFSFAGEQQDSDSKQNCRPTHYGRVVIQRLLAAEVISRRRRTFSAGKPASV